MNNHFSLLRFHRKEELVLVDHFETIMRGYCYCSSDINRRNNRKRQIEDKQPFFFTPLISQKINERR